MIILDDVIDRIRDCLQRKEITSAQLQMILIEEAIKKHNGNKTHAANAIGISIRTLRNKLNKDRDEKETSQNLNSYL